MAEYHFHAEVIRRSVGHPGAVYQAAYNARTSLRDERFGRTFDFSRQDDLVHQEILAPDGAPSWVFDRQTLWNRAEAAERQYNAQPGRYFDIGLPVELSAEARLQLVREFVRHEFVERGMIADVAIHDGDGTNPHFHLLVTMRELDGARFSTRKQRKWNDRALLCHWREAWDYFGNRALAREGHAARIDHRSYADRGINLAPQPKLYRHPSEIPSDPRDHVQERHETLHERREQNGARVLRDPTIVLRLLTSRRSTFTERELVRAVHRLTAESQEAEALAAVKACPELVRLPKPDEKGQPLYSTRTVVARERAILTAAHVLARRTGHRVRETFLEQAVSSSPRALSDEQGAALRHLADSGDLALVQGFAGAGKTTMLQAAHIAWQGQGLTVVGAALMGRAAEQLEQETGIPSRTLKSWQHGWENGHARLTPRHVVVLDEAAMVGTEQFQSLIEQVRESGAKLGLVGDVGQLQPIEIGAPMRLLQERYQPARLQTIHRQRDHAWQREATLRFATGRGADALDLYMREGRVRAHDSATQAQHAIIESWSRDRASAPLEQSLMLAFRRRDVQALNELARAVRKKAGELGAEYQVRTERGARSFATGERIIFLRNDKPLGVKNGTLGTLEHIQNGKLVVRLDGTQRQIVVDPRTYDALDHGYAATIHKSQGATVDRVYVLASRYMEASATYVAMSRHRRDVELHYSREEFKDPTRLVRALSRVRVHRMAHDVLGPDYETSAPTFAETLLRARPADRTVEREVVDNLAAPARLTGAEVLERFETIRALRDAERDAGRAHERGVLSLSNFRAEHPYAASWRLPSYRAREAEVADALVRRKEAQERLRGALQDPELRRKAERIADRHNARTEEARRRADALREAQRAAHRHEMLIGLARADNVRARALLVRAALPQDQGVTFEVVRERNEAGVHVLELRSAQGGPIILAHATDCAPVQGRSVFLRGPEHAPPHLRSRMHDRDFGHGR